jgi:hypothetical protein
MCVQIEWEGECECERAQRKDTVCESIYSSVHCVRMKNAGPPPTKEGMDDDEASDEDKASKEPFLYDQVYKRFCGDSYDPSNLSDVSVPSDN